MMPITTGRLIRLATRCAVPVSPRISQTSPVTRLAPYTIAGVMMRVCAACVVAIAPTAFMGCTGIGVR